MYSLNGKADNRQLRAFEEQLKPFLEMKSQSDGSTMNLKNVYSPSQTDLFFIMKNWTRLSATFQSLYKRSAQIPSFMKYYESPGGHFEIYYATAGMDFTNKSDTVDATDAYGFNSSNWQQRTSAPNGIPDYIDEIAWAFDSAWSMEIDRFGFKEPLPYTSSSHPSGRYKVIAIDMDAHYGINKGRFYGLTTPVTESSKGSIGIRSYIELRNQWKGWTDPDYELHPEQGVRVTAVHEFFHTIQFAMTRNVNQSDSNYLDDFPLTWLEASAVLMEELGFDYINDYLQYATDYFDNPTLDVFKSYGDYTISLLLMYVTQRLSTPGDIGFTKSMLFNNYQSLIDFRDNLLLSAKESGRTWADLLGNFHTESFFTDERSAARPFIADASLLPSWSYEKDVIDNGYSVQKNVSSLAMETFSFKQEQVHGNSLRISFIGDSIPSTEADTNPLWSVHGILRRTDERNDSVFSLPISFTGLSGTFVANWSGFNEALMIVTNAHSNISHSASLVFETCPVTVHAGDSTTYQGVIPAPLSAASSIYVSVKALADLSCSLSIASVIATATQREQAINQKLESIPVLYGISFPKTWSASAAMNMAITEDSSYFTYLKDHYGISSSAFALFFWDPLHGVWNKTDGAQSAGSTYLWHVALHTPGLYGLFAQLSREVDAESLGTIIAYPNPVHRSSEMRFRATGKMLMQLYVYSMNGDLIYKWKTENPVDTMKWSVRNTSGKPINPGMYYALIGYKDALTKGLKKKKQKVLIVP